MTLMDLLTCLCSPDTIETKRAVTKPQSLSACDIDRRCKKTWDRQSKANKRDLFRRDVRAVLLIWRRCLGERFPTFPPGRLISGRQECGHFYPPRVHSTSIYLMPIRDKDIADKRMPTVGQVYEKHGSREWGSCGNVKPSQSDHQHWFCIIYISGSLVLIKLTMQNPGKSKIKLGKIK